MCRVNGARVTGARRAGGRVILWTRLRVSRSASTDAGLAMSDRDYYVSVLMADPYIARRATVSIDSTGGGCEQITVAIIGDDAESRHLAITDANAGAPLPGDALLLIDHDYVRDRGTEGVEFGFLGEGSAGASSWLVELVKEWLREATDPPVFAVSCVATVQFDGSVRVVVDAHSIREAVRECGATGAELECFDMALHSGAIRVDCE